MCMGRSGGLWGQMGLSLGGILGCRSSRLGICGGVVAGSGVGWG